MIASLQVNAVEYALDVIEDHQNQHEGLQHLVEYQVSWGYLFIHASMN
jgi:hypothetical protein